VLRRRKVWGLSLGLACAGYTTWLLLTWLPGYLQTALHMSVLKSGFYTAIPWLVAVVVEFLIPGWLVDHLIRRGQRETVVRKSVLIAGMVVALGIAGAAFTTSVTVALFWITVGTVGITLAYCVSNSLPALIAPEGSVGAVASVMNFVNTMFGLAAPIVTGFLVQATGSFAPAFLVAGVIMPSLIIVGLMAIPYIDANPLGNGYYTYKQRKFAIWTFIFGFIILWVSMIVIGTLIRGPGWMWFWPGTTWDHNRLIFEVNRDLPDIFGIKNALLKNLFGLSVIGVYFVGAWYFIHKLVVSTPLSRKIYARMSLLQYSTMMVFLVIMLALPVKILLRLMFTIKYVWVTPWFNV